jgi:hypothetical protein
MISPVVRNGEGMHSATVDDSPPPMKKRNANSKGSSHFRNESTDSGYSSALLNTSPDRETFSYPTSATSSGWQSSSIEDDAEDAQPGQKRKRRVTRFPGPDVAIGKELQEALKNITQNARGHLREGGYLLLIGDESCGNILSSVFIGFK